VQLHSFIVQMHSFIVQMHMLHRANAHAFIVFEKKERSCTLDKFFYDLIAAPAIFRTRVNIFLMYQLKTDFVLQPN